MELFSYPLSLKFQRQLSLIPNIIETVIPKITYLWKLTISGNFNALKDPDRFLIDKGQVIIYRLVERFKEFSAKD